VQPARVHRPLVSGPVREQGQHIREDNFARLCVNNVMHFDVAARAERLARFG